MKQVLFYRDEDDCWIAGCPSLKGYIHAYL